LRSDPALIERLQGLTDEIGIPLILGAAQVEKFATGGAEVTIGRRIFNTAYLLRPGEALSEPYRKRVLVPFAEYLPHPDIIPWPEWLAPRVSEMTPGEQAHLFRVTADLSVGTLICWENLFSPLAGESVRNGANLLVQLTNDVWFGRSAAPHQHNLMSIMRAVEHRVPIVIASNTGPSQIIDGYGRVLAGLPDLFTVGVATGSIHAQTDSTLYSVLGDLFIPAVFVAWGASSLWRARCLIKRQQGLAWLPNRSGEPLRCSQPETCPDPEKTR
jgi:apolipoprotein N-acyltransferase